MKIKRGKKLITFIGLCLFIFMLSSLFMMSKTLQNSDLFDRFYLSLLLFNALGLITLSILIILNLKRLIRQLKNRVIGARMTVRIVFLFSLLSVTPVLIVYYFSLDFLHRGIDSWFDLKVEKALDDSLELSRLALDVRMRELLNTTEKIAEEMSEINENELPFYIDQIRERINANELTLLNREGVIVVSSSNDTKSLVPNTPEETILLQLVSNNSYIGLDLIKNKGLLIRSVVNVPILGINDREKIIQALFPISERMNQLAANVQTSFIEYKELSYLREQLKFSFIIILTLVLLFSIFSAVWAAFYSASTLSAPIKDLAQGTRAIAKGDYNTKLPVPSNDELGFLVSSFNEMTNKISQARDNAKKSQRDAESQQIYLETILSRLSSGVIVLNNEQEIEKSNISAALILQLEVDILKQKNLKDLMNEFPMLINFFECISINTKEKINDWREQITLSKKTGDQILILNGSVLTNTDNTISKYIVVFDEITALIKGQRDAAWSEIARRLAHEIKNPLTPIQLAAERLRSKYLENLDENNVEMLDRMTNTIINQVETMKGMVNDFSDYAQLEKFKGEKIEILVLIQEGVDLFSNMNSENKIEMEIETNLPKIHGDEKKLRRVLNNLLTNAVDANEMSGNNSLKVSAKTINIKDNDEIEIRIVDSGPGIDPSVENNLLEPYITTKEKGTGLGLAIVKKIIDEHSGAFWLENNNTKSGASAVIRLPVN
ncbi:MAG: two-component sensor histidine kinase [Legionellales bacterium]|nr:two-component sensor histidine kinase [Legionellales bacterium]